MFHRGYFLLTIALVLTVITNISFAHSSPYFDVNTFAKRHGFATYFYPSYNQLVFVKQNKQLRLKINSDLAVIDEKYIVRMSIKVIYYEKIIWVPKQIEKYIYAYNVKRNVQPPQVPRPKANKVPPKQKSQTYPQYSQLPKLQHAKADQITTVIIDPGHGGKDPGNVNNNMKEKDVNLRISKLVRRYIKHYSKDVNVYLTRSTDKYVSLKDRTKMAVDIANKHRGAAIFVSIHANASLNKKAKGIETYYYTTAPDEIRKARSDFIADEVQKYEDVPRSSFDLLVKMYDLQVSKESKLLAKLVHKGLKKQVKSNMKDRGVRGITPYYVITYIPMPAILVEVGFLSNLHDARLLSKSKYRSRTAKGISLGILKFIKYYNSSNGFRTQ